MDPALNSGHERVLVGRYISGVLEEGSIKRVAGDGESWSNVVIVNLNLDDGQVNLNANHRSNDNPDYSVPVSPGLPINNPRIICGGCPFQAFFRV